MLTAHNNNSRNIAGRGNRQRGVSLIEVLMALLVFAIGVAGMAGLQLRTMSMTMDSSQRTYVISASQALADSIRSSGIRSDGVVKMQYLTLDGQLDANICTDPAPASCIGRTCVSATEIAIFDRHDALCMGEGSLNDNVADWQVNIDCAYPDVGGAMTDTTTCTELGSTISITTTWFARSENVDVNGDQSDSMTLRFVP